jgi:hypothetical protein
MLIELKECLLYIVLYGYLNNILLIIITRLLYISLNAYTTKRMFTIYLVLVVYVTNALFST